MNSQTISFYLKAKKLIGTFSVYHFKPIEISEKTSAEVTALFIKELDSRAIVLKQSDVNLLKKQEKELFKSIENNSDSYVENAHNIYLASLKTVDSVLTLLSTKMLNYNENDSAYFLPYNAGPAYSPSLKYHAKRVERYIKIRSYDRVCNQEGFEKLTEAEFNAKAQEFSKTILSSFHKNIKELISRSYKTVESSLLNALALRHDPHSNYFNEEQNKEFNKQLSTKVESFGIYFDDDDDGNIVVSYIEPGGAAWISNEINEGDIFMSFKSTGQTVTNENNTSEEIQNKLDNLADNRVTLTLKKQNGQLKTVKLIKQKITSTENTVKGYILKDKKSKVGYISLPSFYTDMEEHNLPGCANDVAKEILKLEGDTISGLILDLRNNGGGSMLEAMNLAGIFVDEGPLFIYKERNRKPTLQKDINRGTIFKKPLVVMINEGSASASELFSNIVKDYNLGIIVGQTSYGKGTAQSVIPLDTNVLSSKTAMAMNTDFIKITNGKFYRLNCSTHQGIGVVPDIDLPATPGYEFIKESKEEYYLSADSVVKKVVYTPNPPINSAEIKNKSTARVNQSEDFKRYKKTCDSLSLVLNSNRKVPIKFKEYRKYKMEQNRLFESINENLDCKTPVMECANNSFDKKLSEVNEQTKEFNQKIRESINKDLFLNETFNIITDIINQQQK